MPASGFTARHNPNHQPTFHTTSHTSVFLTFLIVGFASYLINPSITCAQQTSQPNQSGQSDLNTPIPLHHKVRTGKLPNGLTYFILPNRQPQGFVDILMAVDVGAVLEEDYEDGLAHFVEHMCFEGTQHLPGESVDSLLRELGLQLGPDLNAYTTWDETVYMLQGVPDTAVSTALWVLSEMIFYPTFDSLQVEEERKVIHQEWRLSTGVWDRVWKQILKQLLPGSKYAQRDIIGKEKVILHAPRDTIFGFYQKWYAPQRMALIIVGDIQPDSVQRWIHQYFGRVTPGSRARPYRPYYPIEPYEGFRVITVIDSEWAFPTLWIGFIQPAETLYTLADWKQHLMHQLVASILQERYKDLERQEDPPFSDPAFEVYTIFRTARFVEWNASISLKEVKRALTALWGEAVRAYQHGFTAAELERAKRRVLRKLRKQWKEQEHIENHHWSFALVDYFLYRQAMPDPHWAYHTSKQLLADITVNDLNQYYRALWQTHNRYIILIVNEKELESAKLPTHRQLLRWVKKIERKRWKPPQEDTLIQQLVSTPPQPSQPPQITLIDSTLNIWRATLANGIQVYMKPTPWKEDEIRITAFQPGGYYALDSHLVYAASILEDVMSEVGAGPFSASQLEKILAGRTVHWSFSIEPLYEEIRGRTAPDDLDVALQVLYLYLTAPRPDSSAFRSWKKRTLLELSFAKSFPIFYLYLEGIKQLYDANPWLTLPDKDRLKATHWYQVYTLFQSEFQQKASQFIWILVGNIDPVPTAQLLNQWLGTLSPAHPLQKDQWIDREVYPRHCDTTLEFRRGAAKRAFTFLVDYLPLPYPWTPSEPIYWQALGVLLDYLVVDSVREGEGEVYSASVEIDVTRDPKPTVELWIMYPSAPHRAHIVEQKIQDVLHNLAHKQLPDQYIEQVRKTMLTDYRENLQRNPWWIQTLSHLLKHNIPFQYVHQMETTIQQINMDTLSLRASLLLNNGCHARLTVEPARTKTTKK